MAIIEASLVILRVLLCFACGLISGSVNRPEVEPLLIVRLKLTARKVCVQTLLWLPSEHHCSEFYTGGEKRV